MRGERSGHFRLIVVLVVVALAGALLTAFTVERGTAAPRAAPDVTWPDDIAPIARRVEQIRGLRFRRAVPVRYVHARHTVSPAVAVDARSLAVLEAAIAPYVAFGLLDGQIDAATLGGTGPDVPAGVYSSDTREIRIGLPAGLASTRKVLAHELTHALEDQHFRDKDRSASTSTQSLAQRAVIEGSASVAQRRYLDARSNAAFQRVTGPAELESGDDASLQKWEFVDALAAAPYALGAAYIDAMVAPGDRTWDDVVVHPPLTDVLILDPLATPGSLWQSTDPGAVTGSTAPSLRLASALEVFLILASRVDPGDALHVITHVSGVTMSTGTVDDRLCSDLAFATSTPDDPSLVATLDRWIAAAGSTYADRYSEPGGTMRVERPSSTPGFPPTSRIVSRPGAAILRSCRGVPVVPFGSFTVPLAQLTNRNAAVARALRRGLDPTVAACIGDAVLADEPLRTHIEQTVETQPRVVGHAPPGAYRRAAVTCGQAA